MCGFPCVAYTGRFSVGDGHGVDGVGVLVVEDEDIVVSPTGWDWESSRLIRVGFEDSLFFEQHGTELVGPWFATSGGDVRVEIGWSWRWEEIAGRADVFCLLILVTQCGGNGFR